MGGSRREPSSIYTPRQSLFLRGDAGDPLPSVWKALDGTGTHFRRGQLALVCAGPGTGKSAWILAYVLKSKVPTLYFSADSDAFTQLTRSVSILSGWSLEKSTSAVMAENLGEVASKLDELPIRFNYSASPSLDELQDSVEAYYAMYEDYPALVVVDNITNVRTMGPEGDDPFSGLESLMDYFHEMARNTASCVVGLHHVTGPYNDGDKPIPLSGIKNQIGRVPELILTMNRVSGYGSDTLNISTVKNRGGKADPSGASYASLEFVASTMKITDY